MKLSVIIPAYNESASIEEVLRRICEVDTGGFKKEIIVVDDGSTDETGRRAAKTKLPLKIRVLRHKHNRGKGASIRTGLRFATGEALIIQDADLELFPEDYPILLRAFSGGSPVVYGSRYLGKKRPPNASFISYAGGKALTTIHNILYRTSLTDINTAYKLFSKKALDDITLDGDGFEFCEEITGKIAKKGIPIVEVSVRFVPRTAANGKKLRAVKDGLIGFWTILKYRFFR